MKKTFAFLAVVLFGLFLVSCKSTVVPTETDPTDPTGSSTEVPTDSLFDVTIAGIDNVRIVVGDEFNILEGVTATGTDNKDYTNKITYTSVATISEEGLLDTSLAGVVAIKYIVRIEEKNFMTEKIRMITVAAPPKPEGVLVSNGTFAEGFLYWDKYNADGSALEESFEDGGIRMDITVGSNIWTPRITQMDIPFEKGKAYRITFEAKATAPKMVNLQVGELIDFDPWFRDFKPGQTEHRMLTTEWAEYSFEFSHIVENELGGVLFEFGKIAGDTLDVGDEVTIWMRNIVAESIVLGEDTTPPVITVSNAQVLVGSAINLANYIHVFDARDGEIPFAELEVEIKDANEDTVDEIDTSVEGVYTVTVTAEDQAGNTATASFTIEVVGLLFYDDNLVENGNFANEFDGEWNLWLQDWGNAADVNLTAVLHMNEVILDVINSSEQTWSVQFYQEGIPFVEGKTYKVAFEIKSGIPSDFHIEVADGLDAGNPVKYFGQNDIATTTEFVLHEYLFTVNSDCQLGKLNFMFGAVDATQFTLRDVKIVEAKLDEIVRNPNFDLSGFTYFINDWEGTAATLTVDEGELVYNITSFGGGYASWLLQLIQDGYSVGLDTPDFINLKPNTEYTLKFDAVSTEEDIQTKVLVASEFDAWKNYIDSEDEMISITNTKQTFVITFTTPEDPYEVLRFKLEFGHGVTPFAAAEGEFVELRFSNFSLMAADEVELLINGDLKQVLGYTYDHSGAGEEAGTIVQTNEGALVTTTIVGEQPYMPHMYQLVEGLAPGNYRFKLVLNSSVERTLRVNITVPNEGFRSLLDGNFYDINISEETVGKDIVVYIDFTVPTQIMNDVKIELSFGKVVEGDVPGEFLIKQVLLYPLF